MCTALRSHRDRQPYCPLNSLPFEALRSAAMSSVLSATDRNGYRRAPFTLHRSHAKTCDTTSEVRPLCNTRNHCNIMALYGTRAPLVG
jgi:hypothetical protein